MSWADDLAAFYLSIIERRVVMRATILERIQIAADLHALQVVAVNLGQQPRTVRQIRGRTDISPRAHQNMPVCSRAASDIMV